MGIKIQPGQTQQGGVTNSKAFRAGLAFVTGGPAGTAMSLAGANNPALGQAAGIAGAIGGGAAPKQMAPGLAPPQEGVQPIEAIPNEEMTRRMESMQPDHEAVLAAGIEALNHPDVPQEIRDAYAEPLLRAKHYGVGGGLA